MPILARFNRYQAAAIHLGLSIVVGAIALAVMLLVWYPQPYFRLAGGQGLIVLMVGVDVVLGPLLTLIVYNPAKKSLRFDLAVIAACQVAALAYGLSVMYAARPAYVVYAGERFTVVAANEINEESIASAQPPYDALPKTGPVMVGAKPPADPEERQRLMMLLTSGIDLPSLPRYYVPMGEVKATMVEKAKPLAQLEAKGPEAATRVAEAVRASGRPAAQLRYVPVAGRMESGAALVDTGSGEVLVVLPIDPW